MTNKKDIYGTVTYNGKTLTLQQHAYLNNNPDPQYLAYEAMALDESDPDSRMYRVTWQCLTGWEQDEDASNHCDWDSYDVSPL